MAHEPPTTAQSTLVIYTDEDAVDQLLHAVRTSGAADWSVTVDPDTHVAVVYGYFTDKRVAQNAVARVGRCGTEYGFDIKKALVL